MEKLRAGKATRVGDLTLIPLFRIQTDCIEQPGFFWLNAIAEPFAVVIVEPKAASAIGVDAEELEVKLLLKHIPDLESVIAYWMTTTADRGFKSHRAEENS